MRKFKMKRGKNVKYMKYRGKKRGKRKSKRIVSYSNSRGGVRL